MSFFIFHDKQVTINIQGHVHEMHFLAVLAQWESKASYIGKQKSLLSMSHASSMKRALHKILLYQEVSIAEVLTKPSVVIITHKISDEPYGVLLR
jgi:hypothetical protein